MLVEIRKIPFEQVALKVANSLGMLDGHSRRGDTEDLQVWINLQSGLKAIFWLTIGTGRTLAFLPTWAPPPTLGLLICTFCPTPTPALQYLSASESLGSALRWPMPLQGRYRYTSPTCRELSVTLFMRVWR